MAPATVDVVRRVLEKAGAEFVDRRVRRRAFAPAAVAAVKDDINRIVARSAALMATSAPMRNDDLYDENGLRRQLSSPTPRPSP